MEYYETSAAAVNVPAPGWYGHPDDRPGIARWWDGRDWSRSTRACLAPLPPPVGDTAPEPSVVAVATPLTSAVAT
jgi:Protein of unknown function (DUF2510)